METNLYVYIYASELIAREILNFIMRGDSLCFKISYVRRPHANYKPLN